MNSAAVVARSNLPKWPIVTLCLRGTEGIVIYYAGTYCYRHIKKRKKQTTYSLLNSWVSASAALLGVWRPRPKSARWLSAISFLVHGACNRMNLLNLLLLCDWVWGFPSMVGFVSVHVWTVADVTYCAGAEGEHPCMGARTECSRFWPWIRSSRGCSSEEIGMCVTTLSLNE